jgi:hypothetical protein
MHTTKKSERPSMSTVIWVDSRRRVSGTDSDFKFELRETVTLQDARVRVDKVNFTDSFLTTDAGSTLYFSNGAGGLKTYQFPEGAYTGSSLSSAIQAATGRTTFYTSLTNTITHPGQFQRALVERRGVRSFLSDRLSVWRQLARSSFLECNPRRWDKFRLTSSLAICQNVSFLIRFSEEHALAMSGSSWPSGHSRHFVFDSTDRRHRLSS